MSCLVPQKHVHHDTPPDMDQLLLRFKATTSSQDQEYLLSLVREDKKRPLSGPLIIAKRQRTKEENEEEEEGKRLVSTVSTEDVFNPWSKFLIESSIAAFPTAVKLKVAKAYANAGDSDVDIMLDPRFTLPQLWHLVSPRHVTNCQVFVDRGGLSYALVALSSRRPCIRKIAYSILQRFYRQLETMQFSSFKDRQLWINFLDMLRSCLTQDNQQLCRLRTSFYTNCISVLRDPGHKLFGDVRQLVLDHSADDAQIARDVVRMAKSSHPKCHKEALEWSLSVMVQGIDQKEDFDLLDKCLAFDFLIEPASSPLFKPEERQMVLFVFEEASKIREAAKCLSRKNALLPFLNTLLFEVELDDVSLVTLFKIACNFSSHYCNDNSDFPDTLLFELCQLLQSLLHHASTLTTCRAPLASKFLNCFIDITTLISQRRGTTDWLTVCDDDLLLIKNIERQLTDAGIHSTQS